MSGLDISSQIVQSLLFGTARDGHAHPDIFVIGRKADLIRTFRKKDIGVLRIAFHSPEYFSVPFWLPIGEIAHACHRLHVRSWCIDDVQLAPHIFRNGKIIRDMKAAAVITGIAITASDGAAYHYIHIHYQRFDTDTHNMMLSPSSGIINRLISAPWW